MYEYLYLGLLYNFYEIKFQIHEKYGILHLSELNYNACILQS